MDAILTRKNRSRHEAMDFFLTVISCWWRLFILIVDNNTTWTWITHSTMILCATQILLSRIAHTKLNILVRQRLRSSTLVANSVWMELIVACSVYLRLAFSPLYCLRSVRRCRSWLERSVSITNLGAVEPPEPKRHTPVWSAILPN